MHHDAPDEIVEALEIVRDGTSSTVQEGSSPHGGVVDENSNTKFTTFHIQENDGQ